MKLSAPVGLAQLAINESINSDTSIPDRQLGG